MTESLPDIPVPLPFLECRLHPVTTRQFMQILARAAKQGVADCGLRIADCEAQPSASQSASQPVGQSASRPVGQSQPSCSFNPQSAIRNPQLDSPQSAIRNSQSSVLSPQSSALLVTYLNAHCSNLAARDEEYRAAVNRFGLVYADGQGVVWASRMLGAPVPERVNAGDFIPDFCRLCAKEGIRLFLLGSYEGVPERAAQAWSKAAPGLVIAGTRHGFFSPQEEENVAAEIIKAKPDILIVGMSAPRQELWTLRWADRLGVPVIWCVGALFEYFSDTRLRAPVWMRRAGLEWLFRLVLEPRRLWRRYLVGNARFAWRVLRTEKNRTED